ncbi:MAG: M12 family metallo-peptidase [Saprospiraceae bacterium]
MTTAQSTDTPIGVPPITPTIAHLFSINETTDPAITKDVLSSATYLDLSQKQLDELHKTRPEQIVLNLPLADGQTIKLALTQQQILTDNFKLYASHTKSEIDYQPGLYYQGEVVGADKSLAAISILQDYVMGVFSFNGENYVLGHLRPNVYPASDKYVLYQESNLLITNPFKCLDLPAPYDPADSFTLDGTTEKSTAMANSVKVYIEGDNDLYRKKGNSTSSATDYITGFFNVVNALYNAESIPTEISEILIWTNSDPYSSTSANDALSAFRSRLNGNFNGDIAHLASIDDANNGGVAYVDVLCQKVFGVAYSDLGTTFNDNPIPTYSWTVEVFTHEMGHNLGSPHTQSCTWPDGAIDGCVSQEGSCERGPIPANGGTIMSYCHLTGTGINFAKGFHELPGNKIRSEFNAASCLTPDNGGGGGGDGGGEGGEIRTPNLTRGNTSLTIDGSVVSINLTIVNDGDGDAGASKIRYYLTVNELIDTGDPILGAKSLPALTAGSSSGNINLTVDVNELNIDAATYYVAYIIDPDEEVEESNEDDNAFWWGDQPVVITNLDYCESKGLSTSYEYISMVKIGDFESSSSDDNGYRMNTTGAAEFPINSPINIELRPGYAGPAYREYWRIWIDLNQDMDFDDAGEMVFDAGAAYARDITGNIALPANATLGKTRMRVSMKGSNDFSAPSHCEDFGYGEVEDFEISLLEGGQLPLTLSSFSGTTEANYNVLQWTTATETGTAFYYLERSKNGKTEFKIVSQLAAAGNSNTEQFYQVKDDAPLRRAFYRLRTQNTDGSEDISTLLFLERKNTNALKINNLHPIPATNRLTIKWSNPTSATTSIRLMDFTGKVVQQHRVNSVAGQQIQQLNVADLNAGIYFITIEQNGQVVSQKVSIR